MTPNQTKIAEYLAPRKLVHGVGTSETPCTMAAINLALTGRLADGLHPCVCPVIRKWVIPIQDAMPLGMLNGPEWRSLVPLIAGSRGDAAAEQKRAEILKDWLFGTVLPQLQTFADEKGFGTEWKAMCKERTEAAADWAARLAPAAVAHAVACAVANATVRLAFAAAVDAAVDTYWQAIAPAKVLRELINVTEGSASEHLPRALTSQPQPTKGEAE